jgi:hypothetical protein
MFEIHVKSSIGYSQEPRRGFFLCSAPAFKENTHEIESILAAWLYAR